MALQTSRTVVPVLGMHRSGTSLTTGILSALGVSLSEDLMPPTQANAIGYFESVGITKIHDELLAALGSSWSTCETLSPFPAQWWRLPEIEPFKQRLKALVSEEMARVSGIWGFKDPRTARLLPLWQDIFAELNVEPRYVLVGRNPLDVARSLEQRDGLAPIQSELLWLEHTTDAVLYAGDRLHAIVEYGRWFDDPLREAEYLIDKLGFEISEPDVLRDCIAKYVSSDLRHHAASQDSYVLPFSKDIYEALLRRDTATLSMLSDLFRVTSTFAHRVVEHDHAVGFNQMAFEQLRLAMDQLQDINENDVRRLLASSDSSIRLTARGALARTAIRRALQYCGELAREQQYSEQSTVTAIQRLVSISDWDEPYIETLKRVGIQAASSGNVNAAMEYLQEAVLRGFSSGQRRDARSRQAMRYAHDCDIEGTIERLAERFTSPPFRHPQQPIRLTVLCTGLADEDGPTVFTVKRVEYFRAEGFDVDIVSTEFGSSANTKMSAKVQAMGVPFTATPTGQWDERIRWLISHFAAHPSDIIVYMTSAQDNLAKLAASIRLAPVQSWDVRALEPQCGKWDLINHNLTAKQETHTRWPGVARFTGSGHAMADEIATAVPFSRQELGLSDDSMLLATFGRLEKANSAAYLSGTAMVLQREPKARLVLAGPDTLNVFPAMLQYYQQFGVANRVHYLGRRQSDGARLVKSVDVYCDSYPWPGGQSLLDAMEAAIPIVAMKRSEDKDLDPTGTGATTAVSDVLFSGLVPMAAAGNAEEYAAIALSYLRYPDLRKRDGTILRDKVRRDCNMRASTALYSKYLRDLVDSHCRSVISKE